MTFPVVAATNSNNGATGTSHTVNLPAGISAGDVIVVIAGSNAGSTSSFTWPAGWEIGEQLSSDRVLSVAARIATGSEGSSVNITSAASCAPVFIAYRITGAHGSTIPEVAFTAQVNTATPDPPSITPSWGSADNLFIAATSRASSNGTPVYPSGYTGSQINQTSLSGATACQMASRNLTAGSENPGTFSYTGGVSANSIAATIAVRPGPPTTTATLSVTEANDTIAATGTLAIAAAL